MRNLVLIIFFWNILMLNPFNTDENFLSSSYGAIVLPKPLLYFQNISLKLHQFSFASGLHLAVDQGIFPSPSSTSCCGRCRIPQPREDAFQRKDQNNHLKTKECTQRIELTERVCLGFFPFPFTCVHVCVYIL